jgi:hypothetical protein
MNVSANYPPCTHSTAQAMRRKNQSENNMEADEFARQFLSKYLDDTVFWNNFEPL